MLVCQETEKLFMLKATYGKCSVSRQETEKCVLFMLKATYGKCSISLSGNREMCSVYVKGNIRKV